MAAPEPVLPAYDGGCLSNLVPALSAPPGGRPAWLPAPAAAATQVVLLVLDGLGWEQLGERQELAPTLAGMSGGPITSVAPTTTATALTSITTGSTPAEHGVVGYRVAVDGPSGREVMNVLRWTTVSGDARAFVPASGFAGRTPFGGRPVPVVSRDTFAGSGFSDAHLPREANRPWHTASGIAVEVAGALRDGAPLVYAYYDGVDKVAHLTGLGDHYAAELAWADRLVADVAAVLPPGAALVVTADHGQVEVGERAEPLDEGLRRRAVAVSGEARWVWLHAGDGDRDGLLQAAEDRYGQVAWVRSVEQIGADGWLGGALDERARRRLGDVAVVAFEPVAFTEPGGSDRRLVCRHGSLTAAEVLVPLLAARG